MSAIITSDGVSITVTGGEKPHVGGMAMSIPFFKQENEKITCDTWVTPRSGHKDDQVAAMVARQVCLETGQATAVVAGIHIDHAQGAEIEQLVENSRQASKIISSKISEMMENQTCTKTSEPLWIN